MRNGRAIAELELGIQPQPGCSRPTGTAAVRCISRTMGRGGTGGGALLGRPPPAAGREPGVDGVGREGGGTEGGEVGMGEATVGRSAWTARRIKPSVEVRLRAASGRRRSMEGRAEARFTAAPKQGGC